MPAASVAVLIAAVLLANAIGRSLGAADVLARGPILLTLDAICGLLVLAAASRAPDLSAAPGALAQVAPRARRAAWPLLLPVLAVAGAALLDRGSTGAVAIATAAAAVGSLALAALLGHRLPATTLALVLYGAGLAMILSFSMRTPFVVGWDINGELSTLEAVLAEGSWARLRPDDAYGAMASVTVLPAALHALSGLGPELVLKLVYPALLATFPCAVFLIARRFLRTRTAFIVAVFVLAQDYFQQQLPAVARQEIALVLFASLVAVLTDRRLPVRQQRLLAAVLGVAIVLSHYTTAYLTIALLVLALLAGLVARLLGRPLREPRTILVALAALGLAAAVWYGPVTHSASNATSFAEDFRRDGLGLLPNADGSLITSYLRGNTSRSITPTGYAARAQETYATERPWIVPLPEARDPAYRLATAAPVAAPGGRVDDLVELARAVVLQSTNLLAVLGALALALGRRRTRAARTAGMLAIGSLGLLAAVRMSGTIATAYNPERMLVQAFALLAPGVGLVLEAIARRRAGRVAAWGWAATILVVLVSTSGLVAVVTGAGGTPNLHRGGESAERFQTSPAEVASARWLGQAAPPEAVIYADRYGQLRLLAHAGRGPSFNTAITPGTLDQHAWVYGSRANMLEGRSRDELQMRLATFRFPTRYLDDHWNRVYVNDESVVYAR